MGRSQHCLDFRLWIQTTVELKDEMSNIRIISIVLSDKEAIVSDSNEYRQITDKTQLD